MVKELLISPDTFLAVEVIRYIERRTVQKAKLFWSDIEGLIQKTKIFVGEPSPEILIDIRDLFIVYISDELEIYQKRYEEFVKKYWVL